MPIGKDSITKRVAKVEEPAITKEATEKPAVKPTAKTGATTAKNSGAKKPAAKTTAKSTSAATKSTTTAAKPAAKKAPVKTAEVKVGVIANVAPETVEKVVGHKENDAVEKVSIGEDMPVHLL